MTTIRQVAQAAGVSIGTVSRALKNQPGLSEVTRQRVLQHAAALGYKMERLRPHRIRRITFLLHRQHTTLTANPFYSAVLQGVEQECQLAGIVLSFLSVGPAEPLQELLRLHDPDALLCAGYFEPEVLAVLAVAGKPLVLLDALAAGLRTVNPNHRQGGYLATQHLLRLGRQRIAFIAGPMSHYSIHERAIGYRQALYDAGRLADPTLEAGVLPGGTVEQEVTRLAHQMLSWNEPPDAFFAYNDAAALLVLQVCRQKGLRVPQDVAIVGFDDIAAASLSDPPLTTIRVNKEALGRSGVLHLLHFHSEEQVSETEAIELVIRASSSI